MKMIRSVIKFLGTKEHLKNEMNFNMFIEKRKNEPKYNIPNIKFKIKLIKEKLDDCEVYHFNDTKNKNVIIYLHGGAYINEINPFHLRIVNRISSRANLDVYLPVYPLLPKSTYKECYIFLLKLYENLISAGKKVIIIGDSAGGGLALGLTQYLKEKDIELPKKIVLISPWVDVTMTNKEIAKYENNDPMLAKYGLIEIGKLWADDLDIKNYKISPLYGDLKGMPDTLIFTSTNDILYPDIVLLNDKLIKNNVKANLIINKELYHIYPLYPNKEGRNAIKQIIEFINEKDYKE